MSFCLSPRAADSRTETKPGAYGTPFNIRLAAPLVTVPTELLADKRN